MFDNIINASISTPEIKGCTYPQGPRGIGIKSISQDADSIIITLDDNSVHTIAFPAWWFGTADEYNALSSEKKTAYYLYFIKDGS